MKFLRFVIALFVLSTLFLGIGCGPEVSTNEPTGDITSYTNKPGLYELESCNYENSVSAQSYTPFGNWVWEEAGSVSTSISSVEVSPNGYMKFNITWTATGIAPSSGRQNGFCKSQDQRTNYIYITDNLGNRYDYLILGGDAPEAIDFRNVGESNSGWYVFPPAKQGATSFAFHDNYSFVFNGADVSDTITGIVLENASLVAKVPTSSGETILTDEAVIGEYYKSCSIDNLDTYDKYLGIRSDGNYIQREYGLTLRGTWELEDESLVLTWAGLKTVWNVGDGTLTDDSDWMWKRYSTRNWDDASATSQAEPIVTTTIVPVATVLDDGIVLIAADGSSSGQYMGWLLGSNLDNQGDPVFSGRYSGFSSSERMVRALFRFDISGWSGGDITFRFSIVNKTSDPVDLAVFVVPDFGQLPARLVSDETDISSLWLAGDQVGPSMRPFNDSEIIVVIPADVADLNKSEDGYLAFMLKCDGEDKVQPSYTSGPGNECRFASYEYVDWFSGVQAIATVSWSVGASSIG